MSKIGQQPIIVPGTVKVEINKNKISIQGSEGKIEIESPREIAITKEENTLLVKRASNWKKIKSLHGLYRQLVENAVIGVEKPWIKKLEIVGTGFNVKPQGEDLVFRLGYSHPVVFKKISGIKFQVEGNNKVTVSGCDKQLVGQTAYQIKILRKPDAYKGKGIRYEGEKLRIKPGKKAKAAGAPA